MKLSRVPFFVLLTLAFWTLFSVAVHAQKCRSTFSAKLFFVADYRQSILPQTHPNFADSAYHPAFDETDKHAVIKTPTDGGIKEVIPAKFQIKYQNWKDELLSTEFGRRQWENYSNNKQFVLTITFGDKQGQGAGTGNYQCDHCFDCKTN